MIKDILKLLLCDLIMVLILVLLANVCIRLQGEFNVQMTTGFLQETDPLICLYIYRVFIGCLQFYITPVLAFIFTWVITRFFGKISKTLAAMNALAFCALCLTSYFIILSYSSGTILFPQDLLLFPAICICFFIVHLLAIILSKGKCQPC